MSGKELLKEIKKDQEMHFVVVRMPRVILTNTSVDDLPEEIQELLENFADIVVDELSHHYYVGHKLRWFKISSYFFFLFLD
jgi:hypothetical protein